MRKLYTFRVKIQPGHIQRRHDDPFHQSPDAINGIIGSIAYIDDGDKDGADLLGFLNGVAAAAASGTLPSPVASAAAAAKSALASTQVAFARGSSTDHRVRYRPTVRSHIIAC